MIASFLKQKVEERRTMVDGAGNVETLITRSVDGQTYCQTVRKNKSGQEEVVEEFKNMNKGETFVTLYGDVNKSCKLLKPHQN